jgi:uncharacterized coiled-coil DUF342 family protein
MDKTNIDDVYISMISKEAEKIEEKFSNGESLTSADIHTLVLKTQYNHINHLDKKLDEVTKDVFLLRSDFEKLELTVNNRMDTLEEKIETEINSIRKDVKNEINSAIINQTKWLIGSAGILIITMKLLDIFVK